MLPAEVEVTHFYGIDLNEAYYGKREKGNW